MMKIAYDHQIFGWQEYGGISRYFFELANNIASNKMAEVALMSPLYINSYIQAACEELHIMGRRVPAIRRTGRIYRAVNQILARPLMHGFSPDIVHETYYSTSRRAPKRSKVVLTVFDMIHERYPESFAAWDTTSQEKAAAVKRADHIICISENTRRDLIEILDVEPDRTSVVHLGFALTNGSAGIAAEPARPYLLYVGSRGGYKNFETLLRAYASVRELRTTYELLAFGGGAFNAKERALIAELGVSDGSVRQVAGDDVRLADLYRNASVFVYPSLYEGFGIPPLEAMSFDCPVACSNSSSIPEVVGDAAILFDPHSVDSITMALLDLSGDHVRCNTLIARGRERLQVFSWKNCSDQTMDIYRSLIK
jgi:glycosyltransferase involved in cell wall biosynthesis